jgi:hypothetical protein
MLVEDVNMWTVFTVELIPVWHKRMINRQAPVANLAVLVVTKQANWRQGARDSTSFHCPTEQQIKE